MLSTYSENLKKIRAELNLSAQKLADKLDVSQSAIAQYESAKREPNYNFMLHLNTKLNVNLNWFCTGEGNMFNSAPENISSDFKDEIIKTVEEYLKTKGI